MWFSKTVILFKDYFKRYAFSILYYDYENIALSTNFSLNASNVLGAYTCWRHWVDFVQLRDKVQYFSWLQQVRQFLTVNAFKYKLWTLHFTVLTTLYSWPVWSSARLSGKVHTQVTSSSLLLLNGYFSVASNITPVPISSSSTTIKCILVLNARLMADTKLGDAVVSTIKCYLQCASLVGQVLKVGKLHWFGTRMTGRHRNNLQQGEDSVRSSDKWALYGRTIMTWSNRPKKE